MLLTLIAETEHELAPIIMHPLGLAGIAAAFFLLAGLVTFSYRDVANRHSDKVGDAPVDAGHH
jgi:hypothetical protein